jgi:serine/threonine protein kinase
MQTRTRRATVANEGGGVLASLSRNVPGAADGKKKVSRRKGDEIMKAEKIEASLLRTPPPIKSVVFGESTADFSPLTLPRLPKQSTTRSTVTVDENDSVIEDSDDEDGDASDVSFSPIKQNKTSTKQRHVVESSDEETEEIQEASKEDDPDETILEEDSDAEDQSDDGTAHNMESEETDSFIEEGDDEDSEAFEGEEDDEYIPDDDDDAGASSDEELSDYVVEEVQQEKRKYRSKRNRSRMSIMPLTPGVKATTDSNEVGNDNDPLDSSDQQPKALDNIDRGAHLPLKQAPSGTVGAALRSSEVDMPNMGALNLESDGADVDVMDDEEHGDIMLATVIEDDDDDFHDEDVLFATIVDDEDDEDNEDDEEVVDHASGRNTSLIAAEDDAELEKSHPGPSPVYGMNSMDELKDHESEKNDRDKTDDIISPPQNVDATKDIHPSGSYEAPKREREGETALAFAPDTPSPKANDRKSRKSFFRAEGIVKRGKWKLGSKIGVGSFGTVHVAMNNETGKLMAVKKIIVDAAIMKDVRREVELMRSLDHQNIVRYLGAEMDKVHLHIFQEWVPGGSVATLLGRFGVFSLQVIQSYLAQTLSGLAYLHDNDIIHRDIKGSNILVNDDGVVKLADFGASKKLNNLRANLMMSMTVRGTPYFMSPEVFEEKYSAKADIWGIGCVAYQMITGSPPWKEGGFSNPISLFNHIRKHDGPPAIGKENTERLSKEDKNVFYFLDDLMHRCFEKDPSKRPDAVCLLKHAFFTEMHHDVDEEPSRGLFSPAHSASETPIYDSKTQTDLSLAAEATSPLRPPAPVLSNTNRKSVVKWRTTFSTPPLSSRKSNQTKGVSPAMPSPYTSPPPDASEWPDWAQAQLEKRTLFSKSPTKGRSMASDVTMDSLAVSADSFALGDQQKERASSSRVSIIDATADQSKLLGLTLLENSNATYEI